MKQFNFSLLLTILLSMVGATAPAHDIEVANVDGHTIYYRWNSSHTELTVSFKGQYYDSYSDEYSGNIVIPEYVTYDGNSYSVTSIGNDAFHGCSGLISVTIGNNVIFINTDAFRDCTGLTSVTIGNSVTSIGYSAFSYCSGLTSVTIPNNVKFIGEWAFNSCTGLAFVNIGNGVTTIGKNAFWGCYGLTNMYCYAENVPSADTNAFYSSSISNATLHVPAASLAAYKSQTPWSSFKEIVALPIKKCATPTITYADGKLSFSCETEDVTYTYYVSYAQGGNADEVQLTVVLNVTVYASKEGYADSDVATIEIPVNLGVGLKGDVNDDGKIDVEDVVGVVNIILDANE